MDSHKFEKRGIKNDAGRVSFFFEKRIVKGLRVQNFESLIDLNHEKNIVKEERNENYECYGRHRSCMKAM